MSTNTSQNLGLHLWEPTDQVLRTEFNQNWTKLDTAVNTAQETAEAVADAYTPSNKPYVVGTYTGPFGGSGSKTFELGFQPSFLILSGNFSSSSSGPAQYGYYIISGGNAHSDMVTFTDTGFTLTQISGKYPYPLYYERTYDYIAFR